MIKNGGFPFNVYSLLYNVCVTTVSDYSAPVTGFLEYDSTLKLQLRAIRAFLGVPKNACSVGVLSEVSLLLPRYRTNIAMVRQYHRMMKMDDKRLTKQVFLWDKMLNETNVISTWSTEVKSVFSDCNMNLIFSTNCSFDLKDTVKRMVENFKKLQNQYLAAECAEKPKLRTFIMFKDFENEPAYITKPLNFFQRRMMAKTRLGCLPIRLETGRYLIPRLPERERTCLVCKSNLIDIIPAGADPVGAGPAGADPAGENPAGADLAGVGPVGGGLAGGGPVESEAHFLFHCEKYKTERDIWLSKMTIPHDFLLFNLETKLKIVLNEPLNVKLTAQFISNAFNIRSKILN